MATPIEAAAPAETAKAPTETAKNPAESPAPEPVRPAPDEVVEPGPGDSREPPAPAPALLQDDWLDSVLSDED